jgi:hypothetical protein
MALISTLFDFRLNTLMVPPPGFKLALLFIAGSLRKIEHTVCSNIFQVFLSDIRDYSQTLTGRSFDESDVGIMRHRLTRSKA